MTVWLEHLYVQDWKEKVLVITAVSPHIDTFPRKGAGCGERVQ